MRYRSLQPVSICMKNLEKSSKLKNLTLCNTQFSELTKISFKCIFIFYKRKSIIIDYRLETTIRWLGSQKMHFWSPKMHRSQKMHWTELIIRSPKMQFRSQKMQSGRKRCIRVKWSGRQRCKVGSQRCILGRKRRIENRGRQRCKF